MSVRTSPWPPGVPCWADLTTPDVAAAQPFYAAVLGWSFPPADDAYGGYVIAEADGSTVAGIGPLTNGGQSPAWTLYLASDDADKTAAAISEAGGTVLAAPFDVGPLGRMLIAIDPSGGAFGVWQAGTHIGASLVNASGGITWEDLRSTNPDAARAFYGQVFGFDFHALEDAGPEYTTFHLTGEEAPLGGIGPMFGEADGTPSHWLVYFSVPDVDASLAAADSHGARLAGPAFDTPYGRMASLLDPAGAAFLLVQTDPNQELPDWSG
jgi:uncharacterized protein